MTTAKDQIIQLVQQQPDDCSYADIVRELVLHLTIERGLKDSDEGRTISNDEMEARINRSAKGAEYDSQGQARSEAERVAPGDGP